MNKKEDILKAKLRKELYAQQSGYVNLNKIPHLKEEHYYITDIPLDGDAPKQYIKAYYNYKNCPRRNEHRNWHGFFAKFGRKSYPHESVIEFIINKAGEELNLLINKTQLVRVGGQVRFLSQDFLSKNQKLIHGIEIIGEYFEDVEFAKEIDQDRKERRKYLTFELIETAITHVYPKNFSEILDDLVKLIVFDAIIGNNDRHYYNWGLIGYVRKSNLESPTFSPIYDTARALLWNFTDEKIESTYAQYKNGSNQLESFIKKSKPRISTESNPDANHFDLVHFLFNYNNNYKEVIVNLINDENRKKVIDCLNKYCTLYFSDTRKSLILALINKRFDYLENAIL
ncbi:MAG: HipA domain-containing protein [Flavobacteriaceae bacterium]